MTDLFLTAARKGFRYDSLIGALTTEQLFELPLASTRSNIASLNDCAVRISRQLKDQGEESFVENRSNPMKTELETKLELVKSVIAIRQAENADATARAARASQNARIDQLIADKKDAELANLSIEELEALKAA
jgi:uncharacterized protein YqgV (UPF0045/DUF77 family)